MYYIIEETRKTCAKKGTRRVRPTKQRKIVKKRKVYRSPSGSRYELRRSKTSGLMYKKYISSARRPSYMRGGGGCGGSHGGYSHATPMPMY